MTALRMFAALLILAVPAAQAAQAQTDRSVQRDRLYQHDGQTFRSLKDCIRAKQRAKRRGTVTGAVVGGAVAAAAGGNAGTTAAVAGAGAAVGRAVGRSSRPEQC